MSSETIGTRSHTTRLTLPDKTGTRIGLITDRLVHKWLKVEKVKGETSRTERVSPQRV